MRPYYSPETVYCLPLSQMARMEMMEMDYNLKKLANFFKFSLWTDRVLGPEFTLDRSFRKKRNYRWSSSGVQRLKYIIHK